MVDIDTGDYGDIGIDHVDRIQPAAQPDFKNDGVQLRFGEHSQNGKRGEFEISQRHISPLRFDRRKVRHQRIVGHRLAVDPRALVEVQQMGRGVQPDPISRLQQDRFQHRAGRALAVGAAYGDNGAIEMDAEVLLDLRNAFQAHVNGLRMHRFKQGQPVGQGGRKILHYFKMGNRTPGGN
jgi:hypothetical protein